MARISICFRCLTLYNRFSLPESFNFSTVVEGWLLLWSCRIALWFAPFPGVLRWAQFCASHFRSSRALAAEMAVNCIARALPFTWHCSCLTQALAGWIMLTRHGTPGRIKIGVSSPAQHGFKAHAWLEVGGQVILGDIAVDIGLDSYHVIWTLPPE
jgi:hypothetical protein